MDKVTAGIILDTRRPRQDNTYPVKLRINYKRNRKYYNIGYFLTEDDFEKVMGDKPRNKFREYKDTFDDKKKEARDMIAKMPVFTFESFKRKFFDSSDYSNLFAAFKYHISKLEKSGQAGTACTYISAQSSFKEFFRKASIPFTSINAKVLGEYETYMKAESKSITTVSMYIRCVKRLYNLAIAAGEVKKDYYPFGRRESGLYEVPEASNHKRAISKEDVRKILNYDAMEGSPE